MELGTLGQTEASIIPVITLLSLGIGLVESFLPLCSLTKVSGWGLPLGVQGALGLAVPSQKAGPIQPWVAKIQACLCDQKCPCLYVCLSFLAPSILSVFLSPSLQATRTMVMAMAMARITPPTMGMVWPLQTLGKCLTLTQMQTLVPWVVPVLIPFCPELTNA